MEALLSCAKGARHAAGREGMASLPRFARHQGRQAFALDGDIRVSPLKADKPGKNPCCMR